MGCCGFGPVKDNNKKRQCKRCNWFIGIVVETAPDGTKTSKDVCTNPSCHSHHKGTKK